MRIGNLDGRLVILTGAGALDGERASGGRFGAGPQAVYDRWAGFTTWAAGQDAAAAYYTGFGLAATGDGSFATIDGGPQPEDLAAIKTGSHAPA